MRLFIFTMALSLSTISISATGDCNCRDNLRDRFNELIDREQEKIFNPCVAKCECGPDGCSTVCVQKCLIKFTDFISGYGVKESE